MNKLGGLILFTAGAAIGSAATWYYTKKKYERIAQEEIDSVKEVFSKRNSKTEESEDDSEEDSICVESAKTDKEINKEIYEKIVNGLDYVDESEDTTEPEADEVPPEQTRKRSSKPPYVISPDEFGEVDEYDQITLTYYADNILADENDEIVENIETTVGFDSLRRFGEYEDDAVHVRNEMYGIDYEILQDTRNYNEVLRP